MNTRYKDLANKYVWRVLFRDKLQIISSLALFYCIGGAPDLIKLWIPFPIRILNIVKNTTVYVRRFVRPPQGWYIDPDPPYYIVPAYSI